MNRHFIKTGISLYFSSGQQNVKEIQKHISFTVNINGLGSTISFPFVSSEKDSWR